MRTTTAVISLFNPTEAVLANAAALLPQVERVVVVDDGSPEDPARLLTELEAMGCVAVRLSENSGIAAALNAGISTALAATPRPDFILTMDQDSLLDPGYVQELLTTAAAASASGVPVGMVAPGSVRGLPVRRGPVRHGVQLGGEPIQSGLLVPVPVIERLGLLQASLFIDGVDSEFYLRCRAHGLEVALAPGASLGHALGSKVPAQVFGRKLSLGGRRLDIRTAAPWRYYYIFRNRILLTRQYGRKFPLWAIKGFLADNRHLIIVTILAPGRWSRLANALAGVADGVGGLSGRRRTP
ncbi:glycosyltransferase [Pseudarthrobacter sp. PH31-O2]|uniref:glycosyltransferase n=1 Tax=Pseudarthrobacter sp. PH31-O2 TaxID=3046206 RepID=UPI0024B96555|nr:glycosyltransferase [Pseudarthrobacter sp. PH31-O2]MDJ0351164.1 glycosyltransferase [Pseudarthrobacter sp. PH31-O2]